MIKSIVQKIMVKEFSKYINGIEYNKLTIEVLGGFFSIENISLNHKFFNSLETPFVVAFSHIGKLSIEAPLTKLSSVPVSCTIQDVYIIAELKKNSAHLCDMSKQELLKKYVRETYELLISKMKEANKEEGMFDKLGKKVVDNLKFQIKNIHIRFEETNERHSYSFGASLQSLTFGTTDKNWKPVFIQREKNKGQEPIFKCMNIENFKIYWQSISGSQKDYLFLQKPSDGDKIEAMKRYVKIDQDSFLSINCLVKLMINPASQTKSPLIELQINLNPIDIKFSKRKIIEVIDFTTSCIKHNEIMLKTLLDKARKKTNHEEEMRMRPLCQYYVRNYIDSQTKKGVANKPEDFSFLFENCSIQHLYEWSMQAIKEKVQELRENQLKKQRKSWFSKAEVSLSAEERKQLERLLDQLAEDSIGGKGRPAECILLKLVLNIKSISFYFFDENKSNKLKTIELSIQQISCFLQKSHNNSWFSIENRIKQIVADLQVQESGKLKRIQLMQNLKEENREYLLQMTYRTSVKVQKATKISYHLNIILGKTLFTYKKEYWKMFSSFFSLPDINQQVQNEAIGKLELFKADSSDEDDEIEIKKLYFIELSLMSPSFILPLTNNSCWYLDLGTITMRSQSQKGQFFYPFKLRELNMRYINNPKAEITSQMVLNSQSYFPIIKNINVDVNMITSQSDQKIVFDIVLPNIELSATRQEFANLLNVKKFLLGEEKDQIQDLQEQKKEKEEVVSKAKLSTRILKRRKYLHNWVEYYCFLSNNSIFFYSNSSDLVPDSVLPLRGAQCFKKIIKGKDSFEFQLEIEIASQITVLRFTNEQILQSWQSELTQSALELKNIDALMLHGESKKKKRRQKKEDMVSLNLCLRQMSWNYLSQKGQSYMRIQLKNINFKVNQKPHEIETVFQVANMSIYDRVFDYQNKRHQHLLISQNLVLTTKNSKEKITKISPTLIQLQLQNLDLNWKPDALLIIIQGIKQFMDIKPISKNRDKTRAQIVDNIKRDSAFIKKNTKYIKEGSDCFVKDKREEYLKINSKDEEIYIKFKADIQNIKINLIHRQSHMPMFMLNCEELSTQLTLAESQKHVKGFIKTMDLYEIFGYPQKKYDINGQYPPFCLLQKKQACQQLNALQFVYSDYNPYEIPNKERVDSFLHLRFAPLKVYYFQEVTMRLIDYFLIQILLLLNNSDMVTANEDILQQLLQNKKAVEKPKYFLDDDFESVVKRYFEPFFMDYLIELDHPEVILTPTKEYTHYFIFNIDKIEVSNRQINTHDRFSRIAYDFKNMVYEEQIVIKGANFTLASINNKFQSKIIKEAFDCDSVVNRLLFEEEITGINPDILGYDRSIKVISNLTAVNFPELSKVIYENLVRLPNFNLAFQDGQEQLFIHNYRITKTLSPKPITYIMRMPSLSMTAQHSIEAIKDRKLKLFSVLINNFEMRYMRDQRLNSTIEIGISEATSNLFEYPDLMKSKEPLTKTLASIKSTKNKNNCFFLIKLANTAKIDIQGYIEECELYMNAGVLPLIADWVQVQDSVFPGSNKMYRPIYCTFRMPKIIVSLQDKLSEQLSLKTVGEMIVEVSRNSGQSQNFLRQGFQGGQISQNYIQTLRQFMSIKVNIKFQFLSSYLGQDRKLIDKVAIQLSQSDFFKIRNNQFRRTMKRRLKVSELRGSISIDDLLLFKCIADTLGQGQLYQQRYKEILQSEFSKAQLVNESSMYRDIFKEQKLLQEMVCQVQAIKFYFISKEGPQYIPIFRLFTNKLELHQFINSSSQVFYGDFNLEVHYFNDQVFRWQPLIEPLILKMNIMKNDQRQQEIELDVINQIFINVSQQSAVSLKKCLKTIEEKIALLEEGKHQPDQAQQFISRYIIKNETGYPIEIFNEQQESMYIIMTGEQVNYTSKNTLACFFEENTSRQTISFTILHPKQELLPVSGISLQSLKSFDIDLYSAKGQKLPPGYGLFLENELQGCKKVLTIRSKKYITDYSENRKVKQFYPFDCEDNVVLQQQHKGFKANFYKRTNSQRFIYDGVYGHLIIRKKHLVYNYTMIPLNVSDCVIFPGQFIGINGSPIIQGVPYNQSYLKVVFNQQKMEYYIYSISYIVDYTNLNFTFDLDSQIKEIYSYYFKENGREMRVYLLPEINTEFIVRKSKNSTKKELRGTLARENFQLTEGNQVFLYSCFSTLETFCQHNIKDFRKVIQITNAYTVCNDTELPLIYNQVDSQLAPFQLAAHKSFPLFWNSTKQKELLQISIYSSKNEWKWSSPLPITQITESFIIRNKYDQSQFYILGLELQQTNNITFIHIIQAASKIQLLNNIPQSFISVYQTVIFQNKNVKLNNPEHYIYNLGYKERKNFGYELPKHDHSVTVQIQLNQQYYNWRCPSFSIDDIENNLVEKTIQVKGKDGNNFINIGLSFNRDAKTMEFSLKKKQIVAQNQKTQIKCKLKAISLSLVGLHDQMRKEIVNCSIRDLNLNFYLNQKQFETSFSAKTFRVENTLKSEPYFVSLLRQAEETQLPAFLFAIKKSRTNPRLVYYVGCSMRKLILTVTSQELQILEENVNSIMEKLNEKSDTNCCINFQHIFTPKKKINDERICFAEAEIHPLRLVMTYKHVNNWGGALLKALSINECKVKVDGKKITNFVANDLLDFSAKIGTHFKEGFTNQIFSMIGSLALLGSPLNLAKKIGCGFANLITLPAEGFDDEGMMGIGKGLALGTGSLLSNTVEGAFGTVESITGTIGNGISGLASYDKDFQRRRQEIKNQRVDHVGEGLLSGGKSIANGFFKGITGLVTEPIKGAEKQGLGGFLKGGLKGLTGLIIKPVSGVIDATSKTAEGIKNTTKVFSKETKQLRIRKYIPRPFYGYSRQIQNYDKELASWNQQLSCYDSKYENLSWAGMFQLRGGQILVVTYQYLLILGKFQFSVKTEVESSNLLSVSRQGEKLVLSVRNNEGQRMNKIVLDPKRREQCGVQLRNLYLHYQKNYEIGIDRRTPK